MLARRPARLSSSGEKFLKKMSCAPWPFRDSSIGIDAADRKTARVNSDFLQIAGCACGPDRFITEFRLGLFCIELVFPARDDHAGEAIAQHVDRGARHVHELIDAKD